MKEVPQWLQQIHSCPIAAEAAAIADNPDSARTTLEITKAAIYRINDAYNSGDIHEKCLAAIYDNPIKLLIEVMALDDKRPLVLRLRTIDEVIRQFSVPANADGTKNIPVGVSAELIPTPLFLPSEGPLVVTGNEHKQNYLIQTIKEANQRLNGPRIRVFEDPTASELNKLLYSTQRRSIIITRAEKTPADDFKKIIRLSRDIPHHHVVLAFSPNNRIQFPPELQTSVRLVCPPDAVYFMKISPGSRDERYFPLKFT